MDISGRTPPKRIPNIYVGEEFILEFEVKHNGHKHNGHKPNNNTTAFLQADTEPYTKNNKKRKPGFTIQRQMDLRGGTNVRIIQKKGIYGMAGLSA